MTYNIEYIKEAYLSDQAIEEIKELETLCQKTDKTSLKLELAYKSVLAKESHKDMRKINEFYCLIENKIIAYVGICGYDGLAIEVNGMVDPAYRRHGIFTELMKMVLEEFKKRPEKKLLLLSDSESVSGQSFMNRLESQYDFSEYEMILPLTEKPTCDIQENMTLKKATNVDAQEVATQNAIIFNKPLDELDMPLPETEEKRGMTIYLALIENRVIGKVNIQLTNGQAGIFGLGVRPEYRGKGYGRALLKFAVTKAYDLKATEVMLQVEAKNEKALNLYTSSGFKVVSKMDYYKYIGE